ncbi:MAG: HK97 family phage prohead protease [Alphaproteobacteria bacterium]
MYTTHAVCASLRERKQLGTCLNIKHLDESGRFAGYASIFNVVDNQRDIVLPGAFRLSLGKQREKVKLLWQHKQHEPIGIIEELFEDANGLYIEGRLLLDVQRAKEAMSLLKSGALQGLSIGYSPVRYRIDPDTGVRLLAEVDLWEISLVTFPANDAARITVVKQAEPLWDTAVCNGDAIALSDALDKALHTLRTL